MTVRVPDLTSDDIDNLSRLKQVKILMLLAPDLPEEILNRLKLRLPSAQVQWIKMSLSDPTGAVRMSNASEG